MLLNKKKIKKFISITSAPKNKSKRGALFSEWGGAYERLLGSTLPF